MDTHKASHIPIASQISVELYARHSFAVEEEWLLQFLSTVKTPLPPVPVLVSTAHYRLLNSNITQSLATTPQTHLHLPADWKPLLLPANCTDVNEKLTTIPTAVVVQVLTIESISTSKVHQIEEIDRFEHGEDVRGREIIRTVPIMNELNNPNDLISTGTNPTSASGSAEIVKKSNGPHKVLLQDAGGTKIYGLEVFTIPRLFVTNTPEEGGIGIGCKLLLKRGCSIRRGMVMLAPHDVVVVGGKVDEWDVAWRKGRKERLIAELRNEQEGSGPDLDAMED